MALRLNDNQILELPTNRLDLRSFGRILTFRCRYAAHRLTSLVIPELTRPGWGSWLEGERALDVWQALRRQCQLPGCENLTRKRFAHREQCVELVGKRGRPVANLN